MRKLILTGLFLCLGTALFAQNYFDILKATHHSTTLGNVDTELESDVSNTNIELYYPFPLSSKVTVITGFTYENTRLGLINNPSLVDTDFPVGDLDLENVAFDTSRTNLIMTRLNLGVKLAHGTQWSGTYVLLPKLASDFADTGSEDFQFGALGLLEKRYSSRKSIKFGAYVSSENFGTTITPLFGIWYKSKNRKFTVNATLPIRSDVTYDLGERFQVGANLLTSVKAYNLSDLNSDFYVQEESIRFSLMASFDIIDDMLLIRGRVGLDTTDYGLYEQGDKIGVQLLTFQLAGDDRNRLNSEFEAAPFFGLDLIFRAGL